MLKKTLLILVVPLVVLCAWSASSHAQPAEDVPSGANVKTANANEASRKIAAARALIEKKGERAFTEFLNNSDEWLGPDNAIYVIKATKGGTNEGSFVIYPPASNVSTDAMAMPLVNGKPFSLVTKSNITDQKKIHTSFFENKPEGTIHYHASTLAKTPDGRTYIVAAGTNNFHMQKLFIMTLVDTACDLIARKGAGAFPELAANNSMFRFQDTYVYVLDTTGKILVDPGNPQLEGKSLASGHPIAPGFKYPVFGATMAEAMQLAFAGSFPDSSEEFLASWQEVSAATGTAWAAYVTPRPGETKMSRKIAYEKLVRGANGKDYIVGSGVYLADFGT